MGLGMECQLELPSERTVASHGALSKGLTLTSILSVKSFGTLEYWFSLIKVITILAFIGLGAFAIASALPSSSASGFGHLWQDGGFAPTGLPGIASALVLALFSFTGMEIVTIAATESEDPRANIRRAIHSVVWRMLIFYFGSIFVIVALVAWNSPQLQVGSFQSALEVMGVPGAAGIIQAVILVGVASTLSSAIFTASGWVTRWQCAETLHGHGHRERLMVCRRSPSSTRAPVPWYFG